jgi:hypothetical protein
MLVATAWIDLEPNLRHPIVVSSAELVVALIALGWWAMIAKPSSVGFTRLIWTLGVLTLFFHIVLAFWLAHGWSHNAAVEHVREVGGFGGGIVVNYLFALIWMADVVWWWINPVSRANRPRWMGWAIHGFLAFVVFNATVIFGSPERRVIYGAMFLALAILGLSRRAEFKKTR